MDVNNLIANNLKALREQKKLSLDNLAKITGVSKSMLGQIERGTVNPTISVIWKISNGLKISFTSLMEIPAKETEVVKRGENISFVSDNEKYINHLIFPFDEIRRFEIYRIEIKPFGRLDSEAHFKGTEEFMTVFRGKVVIIVNNTEHKLDEGDSIRFNADKPHSYCDDGDSGAELGMVIYYAK